MFFCTVITATPVLAVAVIPIKLDGQFNDWYGRMNVTDPTGDATVPGGDITAFYWANNPNDNNCYWMLQRVTSQLNVGYIVYFDANNNGNYNEHIDRVVCVNHNPQNNNSNVTVDVRYADTWQLISESKNNNWGESKNNGASKVEFGASFADLGFGTGQTIRMYAVSFVSQSGGDVDLTNKSQLPNPTDRVPDNGDIQWSPIPLLGYPLLIVVAVGGILLIWYFKGRHMWHSA